MNTAQSRDFTSTEMSEASEICAKAPPGLETISRLTHAQMAFIHRYAPIGHLYFRKDSPELEAFTNRFTSFGGMTPEVSKLINSFNDHA